MIGVLAKSDQIGTVEEFFQLFKTPWEFYRAGRTYDVVIATVNDIPDVDARLLVIYGAEIKNSDGKDGMVARSRHRGVSLSYHGIQLPVYGEVLTFTLPNSGLSITYSTRYFRTQDQDTPSLLPDVAVTISAADFFAGRDPVLDAVLAY